MLIVLVEVEEILFVVINLSWCLLLVELIEIKWFCLFIVVFDGLFLVFDFFKLFVKLL